MWTALRPPTTVRYPAGPGHDHSHPVHPVHDRGQLPVGDSVLVQGERRGPDLEEGVQDQDHVVVAVIAQVLRAHLLHLHLKMSRNWDQNLLR